MSLDIKEDIGSPMRDFNPVR